MGCIGVKRRKQKPENRAILAPGIIYGRTEIRTTNGANFPTTGQGADLQGELTAGYEIARVTSARLFAQADVTLPFYHVVSGAYLVSRGPGHRPLRAADHRHRTTVRAVGDALDRARLAALASLSERD